MAGTTEQVLVVGAGFSSYAGLPLQSQFTEELLSAADFKTGPSKRLVDFLSEFVGEAFHTDLDHWPELEDLFTCIDLSANTGHHLGRRYCPSLLRTVRRAMIARIVRMLRQSYVRASKDPDERWQKLRDLLAKIDPTTTAFLSLNWDTVAEESILEIHDTLTLDYGAGFTTAQFPDRGRRVQTYKPPKNAQAFHIAKLHGSVNWLYCDNCRRVYWFPPDETVVIANQLLSRDEWRIIAPRSKSNAKRPFECEQCEEVPLSTRIATFSYRKALDFPMFQRSWSHAERMLRAAHRWVFIGYSLPAADFEFKYLLKRIELSRPAPPEIVLVTGGKGGPATRANFEAFFGSRLSRLEFPGGLTDDAIAFIARV